jgi:hypothetical protein
MRKSILIAIFLMPVLYFNTVMAQDELRDSQIRNTKKDTKTFNVLSLDGKNESVKIIPDYVNKVLEITCSKDALTINNFWGVPPVIHLLGKNLIQIDYEVRGGSNLGLGYTLILCVRQNRLFKAFHILRHANWDNGDLKMNYYINLKLSGTNKSNYELNVSVHDDVNSKPDPERNYNFNEQVNLNFDIRQNVFYSIKGNVFNRFVYTDAKRKTKQKLDGFVPVIMLGKETYYFIGKAWYRPGENKEMSLFE